MSRPNYLPVNDTELDIWLKNFYTKLALNAAQFSITAAELAATLADSNMLTYIVAQLAIQQHELQKRFEFKRTFIEADLGATLGAFPTSATIAAAPAAVPAGLVKRIANMVRRIKGMPAYTENIGRDLGIIPVKTAKLLRADEKPSFVLTTDAGHPMIKWRKNGIDSVNIYVDRGEGKGFLLVCGCPRAKFVDMYPLPVTVTNWTYIIVYTKGIKEYGLFSDPSIISVFNSLTLPEAKP